MKGYINPTADIVIKFMLGVPEAEPALVGFINAVLEDSGFPQITQAKVLNPFNIYYANRSLYYWSQLFSRQIKESEQYRELTPVICINLLEFILFPKLS